MIAVFQKTNYMDDLRNGRFWMLPVQFVRDISCCIQRSQKGYCYRDLWEIDSWFLEIMPGMLREFKKEEIQISRMFEEYEVGKENGIENRDVHQGGDNKSWEDTLERMAFLFTEAYEMTCSRKNPYEAEFEKCCEDFERKYGVFGENLKTPEQMEHEEKSRIERVYLPSDIPEYAGICEKCEREDEKLAEYRDECKDEAFRLFSENFWELWS